MRIADYGITEEADGIAVDGVTDFVPAHVFGNGQSFRWKQERDGSYTGIVQGKVANINYVNDRLLIRNATVEDFHLLWFHYFDLSTNYAELKAQLSTDPVLAEPIRFGHGLRMLKQEFWEVLVSYIISTRNNIPQIGRSVEAICQAYDNRVDSFQRTYYAFPSPKQVVNIGKDKLTQINLGLTTRSVAIFAAAEALVQKTIDVQSLGTLPVERARGILQRLYGVGPKVADCTLSFSGMRKDVFPTDRWMKRAMEKLYDQQFADETAVYHCAKQRYGILMSYAQGYLFYYAWQKKIGES
jgi:N-glycosylase/DNA lyase